jgi:endonuclease-3
VNSINLDVAIKRLKKRYPYDRKQFLEFSNPWESLVATILSAQSQDKQVNKATKILFKRYRTVEDYCNLKPRELYNYISSIGLYRGKGKNIIAAARIIRDKYHSKVPQSIEELTTLPGVGRKTANVVLTNAYGITKGIAVDTHCITVSNRLGLVRGKNPIKIEEKLVKVVPKKEWKNINHLFISLGRDVCTARRKFCERCVLNDICPSSEVVK